MGIKSIKAVCGGDIRPDAKRLNPHLYHLPKTEGDIPVKRKSLQNC